MKKKTVKKLIIEIVEGIISGIYTDSGEKFIVEITDPEDIYDPERKEDRERLEKVINSGCLVNVLENDEIS